MSPVAHRAVPPRRPAGRPRLWQAALIALACGGTAAASCAEFLRRVNRPSRDPAGLADGFAVLFIASLAAASGPLMLVAFRLGRGRPGAPWPGPALLARPVLAGAVLAPAGWLGVAWSINSAPLRWRPATMILSSTVFVLGLVLLFGAVELLVLGGSRRTTSRRRST